MQAEQGVPSLHEWVTLEMNGRNVSISVHERYTMILPKDRDPRFITIRRGGTLTDADHHLLAWWAAACAEHVLPFFESAKPADPRPRQAVEQARAWARGEIPMSQARAAGGHAMAAARDLSGAARHAAYAAGQAAVVAHVPAPQLTRSRPRVRLRLKARARGPVGSNAAGSATSCRMRFAIWSWTINGCETISAGRSSTADGRLACASTAQQALRAEAASVYADAGRG
jgi:hypothetical protein